MSTLTQLRTKVSRRLEDTANSHWSTAEIDDFINESRMDIWQLVRRVNPHVLPVKSITKTWTADTLSVDLSTGAYIGEQDFDVYLMSMTETTEAISSTNRPIPLSRIPYEEVNRTGFSGALFHENQKHYGSLETGDAWGYSGVDGGVETANTWGPGGHSAIYAWALQGHKLYLSPVPSREIQVYIEYIRPFATLTAGGDPIFDNDHAMFRPWEAVAELGAVLAAKGRSDEETDPTMAQWQYKMELFMRWLENREVTGTPTVILGGY